ncbi:MAG TPA: EpsI family protein [Candidatus Bathyarchaeia archaeon]|nr:EpsI family protein [Candidatus Bathyarchaeia archaeon]
MKASVRYWVMLGVLLCATTGMKYLSHGEATPPAKPLSQFPTKIGPYASLIDAPLDKETLDILKVTDYLNRGYWAPGMGQHTLGLYIGYFRTQRSGAAIHSPKNCLPGAGWNPVNATVYQLPLEDGRKVPVNLYYLRRGLDEEVVVYWYQSHGRVIASEYWGKFYLVYDALRLNRTDAALVRITVPVENGDEGTAKDRALAFAKTITTNIDQVIPR